VNDGVNIASVEGEPVWAAADGEVVYVGNELKGYGNMVLIKHSGSKTTSYAHLNRATVDKYDRVKQGDIIGYVGSTGNVKSSQLHFAIRDGTKPVDPKKYLSTKVAGL
jgi:murein DD-endopeptidase MepM/ murein hydrolase activator NlpD